MPNNPIRQHWIPRVYLRSFCSPPVQREQIYAYDLADGRQFKTSIANVAVMRHLYTLELGGDEPSYAVENALSQIESAASPLLTAMIESEELVPSGVSRKVFATFLGTLFMRTRQGIQMVYAHREEIRAGISPENTEVPLPLAEYLLRLDEEGMRELFAKAVISVGSLLSTILCTMNWRLLRASEDYFLTSESPIVVYHAEKKNWGIGTPGAHIHMPLAPNLLLHISSKELIPSTGTFDLSAAGVRGINGLTVLSSDQHLFSHTSFEYMRELIKDRPTGSHREFGPIRVE